ncbi:acyl-CoA dehydrogenase family protein [Nocardia brevicatena]|uniref:acyl-CoA dehydrogenase family protein n=1 Tax=Nocardia brevicatena TaxID=37327 RepID=UPI0002DAC7B5|nr:acyl-CoA dehydrogenase family protein [Nocardia brevicatena]
MRHDAIRGTHPARGPLAGQPIGSGPDSDTLRERVRRFLRESLPADWRGVGALSEQQRSVFLPAWRDTLRASGYLGISWPVQYGGAGLSVLEQCVVQEEFVLAGVPLLPLPNDPFGFSLIGPTLLRWGTEEQKRFFLPRILSGEHRWAQGYSEPEAGSDLFGLRTSAEVVDDEWVINGQKVWQTAGDTANWIFTLTRTEPDRPGSRGLSLLLIPIDQAGVEVRPIRTMTGHSEFCEVFFSDARTAIGNVVGERGDGARVALTLLGYERGAASGAAYAGYRVELDRLVGLIADRGLQDDPLIRQRVARCWSKVEITRLLGLEIMSAIVSGAAPDAESSLIKLLLSEHHAELTELATDILGMDVLLVGGDGAAAEIGPDPLGAPNSPAAWQQKFLTARAGTIYGGSSQIQRNTLGEQLLGLPREPRAVRSRG